MNRVDAGFAPERVLAVSFAPNWSKYRTNDMRRSFINRLLEKVQGQPGVRFAAVSNTFPLDPENMAMADGMTHQWNYTVEGDPRSESEWPAVRAARFVSPGYFNVLGVPLLSGRTFTDADGDGAEQVVVINRALARQAWRNESPVGHRLSFNGGRTFTRIIGVAGDTKEFGVARESPFEAYFAAAQFPAPGVILARTTGDPQSMADLVRRAVLEADPDTAITSVQTMEQVRADSVASPRTTTRMFGLFAILALLIAVAGIGSMLALWVKQRAREIGIRIVVGAKPAHILATVLRQGMWLVTIGLCVGYVGALALSRFLKAFLFQVEPTDLATYAAVSALLLLAALIACFLPARSAAQIDPQSALRCD
jgi:predicted permease